MAEVSTCTSGGLLLFRPRFSNSEHEMYVYNEITDALIHHLSTPGKKFNDAQDNFPLRRSLFAHVAPYIRFRTFNSKGPSGFPREITRHLKFLLGKRVPRIVRQTLSQSGCSFGAKTSVWYGTWGIRLQPVCALKQLKGFQKVNNIPGTMRLSRKDHLWTHLNAMISKFGKKAFGFIPSSYVIPRDCRRLRKDWERNQGRKWIVKPPETDRGNGVRVVNEWWEIPKYRNMVVQRYLSRPKLIHGRKFDLRLYVLTTSYNPLRVYLYTEGLVRFATVKYNGDNRYLTERCMHLTNTNVNRKNIAFKAPLSVDSQSGHLWSLKTLWTYLRKEGVDVVGIWEEIKDIVIKTMISGEPAISKAIEANTSSRYSCYELFGFDVILDQEFKPWLLEVNCGPSMCTKSSVEYAVKGPLLKDAMNMAGYQLPTSLSKETVRSLSKMYRRGPVCYDFRLYDVDLTTRERAKQGFYEDRRSREEYLVPILEDLTPDDVRHLVQYEDELTQAGGFQKAFPSTTSHNYLHYFRIPKYYNMLLDAWETKYGAYRENGIQTLQELCRRKFHLRQSI